MIAQPKRNAKAIQKKSRTHQVEQVSTHLYHVTSGESGKTYQVTMTLSGPQCGCNWGQYRRPGQPCGCSHTTSVLNYIAKQAGATVSVWATAEDAKRQKRSTMDIGDGLIITTRK